MSGLTSAPVQVLETTKPLHLEVARSLGELTVVPPTASPQDAYDRALALIEATRKEVAAVTSVKGPAVAPSARDTWLKDNNAVGALPLVVSLVSGVVAVLAGLLPEGSTTVSMYAAASCVASAVPFIHIIRAETRLERAKAKHAAEVIDTGDLDRMLASLRASTPEERAMVQPFVEAALRPIDAALSAKAAAAHDRLMAGLPALEGATARAATLALIVDDLRHGARLDTHLETLHRLFHEATAQERPILAANLEGGAFEGEKALVQGDKHDVRRLYSLIEAGLRGEAMAPVEA